MRAACSEKQRAERRARVAGWTAVGAALLIAVLSFAISVSSASKGSEEFLASARAETGHGARADLDDANTRLLARGLPVFEVPPVAAPNFIVQRQAARAWARVDYPESWAQEIRDEVRAGRRQPVEPAANLAGRPSGDRIVTVVPISPAGPTLVEIPPRSSGAPTGRTPAPPASPNGTGAVTDPAAPATPPAPSQAPQRGLLPLLPDLPVRVPLLSQ